jgi:DNA-binding GntR family transcriptional regulator
VQQHDDLLEALRKNDPGAAAAITYHHIMGVERDRLPSPGGPGA